MLHGIRASALGSARRGGPTDALRCLRLTFACKVDLELHHLDVGGVREKLLDRFADLPLLDLAEGGGVAAAGNGLMAHSCFVGDG